MPPTILEGLGEVRSSVGRTLGTTGWTELTVEQVALFDRAVGAADGGSAGRVPPFLVLALTNLFMPQLVEVRGVALGVNYGTGAVRFPATARAGDRLRASAELVACDDIAGGVQTTIRITVEVDGGTELVCVVDALSRWMV
jgi:acyl dehydratase